MQYLDIPAHAVLFGCDAERFTKAGAERRCNFAAGVVQLPCGEFLCLHKCECILKQGSFILAYAAPAAGFFVCALRRSPAPSATFLTALGETRCAGDTKFTLDCEN